jgi:hypothetical protein
VFIRQTNNIFGNAWPSYLENGGLSVGLRNGSALSVWLRHLPEYPTVLARRCRYHATHERPSSHDKLASMYSNYALIVSAAENSLRLCELIRSSWSVIADRVVSNGEVSFVCGRADRDGKEFKS